MIYCKIKNVRYIHGDSETGLGYIVFIYALQPDGAIYSPHSGKMVHQQDRKDMYYTLPKKFVYDLYDLL